MIQATLDGIPSGKELEHFEDRCGWDRDDKTRSIDYVMPTTLPQEGS